MQVCVCVCVCVCACVCWGGGWVLSMPVNYLLELAFPEQCLWYVVSLSTICVRAACNNWTGLHSAHTHTHTHKDPPKLPHNPPSDKQNAQLHSRAEHADSNEVETQKMRTIPLINIKATQLQKQSFHIAKKIK